MLNSIRHLEQNTSKLSDSKYQQHRRFSFVTEIVPEYYKYFKAFRFQVQISALSAPFYSDFQQTSVNNRD